MRFALVAPNVANPGTFYEIFADFLRVAARQLDVDFEAVDGAKDPAIMLNRSREVATGSRRPDYMLLVNYQGAGHDLLAVNATASVGTFFVVEGMAGAELGHGGGRRREPGYLGQIVPDDVEAGRMLAQILTDSARARGMADAAGKIHVGAIAGEHTQAGNARFRGRQTVPKEHADVRAGRLPVRHLGGAAGEGGSVTDAPRDARDTACSGAPTTRWPSGALDAAVEAGRHPGKDILIGGIDLIDRALAEVAAGRLEVSIGGHLVDGVRALILLHDHHENRDLIPQTRTTHLVAVRTAQADRYLRFMRERGWRQVDFTRFSCLRNPGVSEASLSLDSILPS